MNSRYRGLLTMCGMMACMDQNINNHSDNPTRVISSSSENIKKQPQRFTIRGVEVYAMNYKSALKKAKRKAKK